MFVNVWCIRKLIQRLNYREWIISICFWSAAVNVVNSINGQKWKIHWYYYYYWWLLLVFVNYIDFYEIINFRKFILNHIIYESNKCFITFSFDDEQWTLNTTEQVAEHCVPNGIYLELIYIHFNQSIAANKNCFETRHDIAPPNTLVASFYERKRIIYCQRCPHSTDINYIINILLFHTRIKSTFPQWHFESLSLLWMNLLLWHERRTILPLVVTIHQLLCQNAINLFVHTHTLATHTIQC